MRILSMAAVLALGLLLPMAASAQDANVERQLAQLGIDAQVDDDGDFRVIHELDAGRTQLVLVISSIQTYHSHKVREIWAPAYRAPGDSFSALVANELLSDTWENKMGAWAKHGDMAMYVVKLPADASADELGDAIRFAAEIADRMEVVLTDGEDEF